jgi:hypothetical protein
VKFRQAARPILVLPANYHEVSYMSINERGMLLWLNVMSLVPLVIVGLLVFGALLVYHDQLGGPLVIHALPEEIPPVAGFALIVLVLPLHELIHGLAIRHFGHKPRYGVKRFVLFATSDGALFRRAEFIRIALAPLAVITVIGGGLMLFLPPNVGSWVGWAVVVNAAGAIGDLWMTSVTLRYDPSVLIRDEEDSMRIFAQMDSRI